MCQQIYRAVLSIVSIRQLFEIVCEQLQQSCWLCVTPNHGGGSLAACEQRNFAKEVALRVRHDYANSIYLCVTRATEDDKHSVRLATLLNDRLPRREGHYLEHRDKATALLGCEILTQRHCVQEIAVIILRLGTSRTRR